ncbi:MAG: hypothetical protein H0X33_06020 [Taibaiella sp.]|nr:hypothetical protein [Taibaiella sp.]
MRPKPFSFEQASTICKDFSHLLGTEYHTGSGVSIKHVAVAPFDEENKDVFIYNYKTQKKITKESLLGYSGPFYDVLVIGHHQEDPNDIHHTHIRNYAKTRDVSYTFPEFPYL